ncbi:YcnI family copper-binding membrane protein [Paenibacillus mendelii]|uniref:YcnI family protein n=1 Tax=Paenibacillus mendelii TaxID=206163 RepID=A0ABV6J8Z6_9BACL|nr:YcnI family protein [Paenibacillus mendelii]MCQ6559615.1 YcnI family protein [Paenibacillus mendelii]
MKRLSMISMAMLSMLLFASVASAHVTVMPKQAAQGSYEVFTVRVPSEKESVTTKSIKVTIAEGAAVSRVEPKPGWKYELEKGADEAIKSVTWTAEGDGLAQTEFTEFRMSGKVADDAKDLVWKAYQTYSDNEVVEWIGADDNAKYPASVTTITAGTANSDGHGAPAAEAGSETEAEADEESGSSAVQLVLSIAALVVAAAALIAALTRRK